MVSHSDGLTTETTAQGGLFGGLKRMVAGESFFQNAWKSTILGGEGLVCRLTAPGRVLMQSRSEEAFLGWLLPKIPSQSN